MINFDELKEIFIQQMNGGSGFTKAKMFTDGKIKIMLSTLEAGCSIGLHEHKTSCEVIYIISGEALCTLNGKEEIIKTGECHYCPKNGSHSIKNNANTSLLMFDVVPET